MKRIFLLMTLLALLAALAGCANRAEPPQPTAPGAPEATEAGDAGAGDAGNAEAGDAGAGDAEAGDAGNAEAGDAETAPDADALPLDQAPSIAEVDGVLTAVGDEGMMFTMTQTPGLYLHTLVSKTADAVTGFTRDEQALFIEDGSALLGGNFVQSYPMAVTEPGVATYMTLATGRHSVTVRKLSGEDDGVAIPQHIRAKGSQTAGVYLLADPAQFEVRCEDAKGLHFSAWLVPDEGDAVLLCSNDATDMRAAGPVHTKRIYTREGLVALCVIAGGDAAWSVNVTPHE